MDTGTAELLADADRPSSWMLLVDGTPQSHVDLDDPGYLDFEYIRRIGHLCDLLDPTGAAIDAVHLGAGALTLPRYLQLIRPGSRQRVFEIDAALVELIRRQLPLPRAARIRIRAMDAQVGLQSLRHNTADLVVGDVFSGARTPAHLSTVDFARLVARILRPGGCYAVNIADGPPLTFARCQLATLAAVFDNIAVLADPGVLRGRRFGNLAAVASGGALPVAELARRCARDPWPGRVLAGADLARFIGSAAPITGVSALASPAPPPNLFGRL